MHQGALLLVEDDRALRHSLRSMLGALGFMVENVATGESAIALISTYKPEVVLLDLNMPGMGGIAACSALRELLPGISILVLTVRDQESDVVAALEAGADDYMVKPFRFPELVARIRAAIRRVRRTSVEHVPEPIKVGPFVLDPSVHRLTRDGTEVHLTPKEFELLHMLMRHAGRPLGHARLLKRVWGAEYGEEREYLRTYVSQLRRKLEDDPTRPRYLTTENYFGYRFRIE